MKLSNIAYQIGLIAEALAHNDTVSLGVALNGIFGQMHHEGHIDADLAVFLNAASMCLIKSQDDNFDPADAASYILQRSWQRSETKKSEVNPCTQDPT